MKSGGKWRLYRWDFCRDWVKSTNGILCEFTRQKARILKQSDMSIIESYKKNIVFDE